MDIIKLLLEKKLGGGVTIVALIIILSVVAGKISGTTTDGIPDTVKLPFLIIAGLILLVVVLAILTVSFWSLDLTDKNQALGLPEGTIRAVIALALVVIFSILSIFLYINISQGKSNFVKGWSMDKINDFVASHPTVNNVNIIETNVTDPSKPAEYIFTYSQNQNTPDSNDFAKQLLVLLGTLMTSVTSFYLGSRTTTTAASSAQSVDAPSPSLRNLTPKEAKKTDNPLRLKIEGDNLNSIKQVKIVNAEKQLVGTNVISNDSVVSCEIQVDGQSLGEWDVVVIDASSKSARLQKALKIVN